MFDELSRELRRLGRVHRVPVTVRLDDDGYFDRECPSPECRFQFKVYEEHWRDKVREPKAFCPFCGHTAAPTDWCTREQSELFRKAAIAHLQRQIVPATKRDAARWNRRQSRNSFIRMTMKVDSRPRHVPVPPAAAEPMQLKIICPECACRYAVIGAAFFCPACGCSAAEQVFGQSLTGIRSTLAALTEVRTAIEDRDTAETTVRLLMESSLQNAITAFQRYVEVLYDRCSPKLSARCNVFQNLIQGSDLWHAATGNRYTAHLDSGELAALTRAFQQRHLLAHRQGLVDQDYITRSGDTAYRPGQRLVIRVHAVRECVDLIEKLASGMASDVQGMRATRHIP